MLDDGMTKERDTGTVADEKHSIGGATDTAGRAPPDANRQTDTDGGGRLTQSNQFAQGTGVTCNEDVDKATTRTPNGTPPVNRRTDDFPVSEIASGPLTDGRLLTLNEELGSVAGPETWSNALVDFGGAGTSSWASLQEETGAGGPNTSRLGAQSPLGDASTACAVKNTRDVAIIPYGSQEVPSLQRGREDPSPKEGEAVERAPTNPLDVLVEPRDTLSLGARTVKGLLERDERLDGEIVESCQKKGSCSSLSTDDNGDHNNGRHASFGPKAALLTPVRGDQDFAISQSVTSSHNTSEEGIVSLPTVLDLEAESQERKENDGSHPTSSQAGNQNHTLGQGSVSNSAEVTPELASTELRTDPRTDPKESGGGSIGESAVARTDAVPPRAWVFPPVFNALVLLSTVDDAVECTVSGEISLEQDFSLLKAEHKESRTRFVTHGSGRGAEEAASAASRCRADMKSLPENKPAWRGLFCTYKIARQSNVPPADIDLEDDDAQARLENLLTREYGLTMEEVLQQFRPETDLTSGEKVVQSFADSIAQLRPSQRQSCGETGGSTRIEAVREAVGEALRGPPGWEGMLVHVNASRVLGVDIISGVGGRAGTIDECGDADSDTARVAVTLSALSGTVCRVDCSGITSPSELKQHLLDKGVPASAVEVLERARFLTGPAMDVAGVLAALAEETRRNHPPARSYLQAVKGGDQESPAVYSDRNTGQLLRPNFDNKKENGCECTVAVTGTSNDMNIEIALVAAASSDDGVDNATVAATTVRALVSRLWASSDDDPLHCPSACSTVSTTIQLLPSSDDVGAAVAAKNPGSDKGSLDENNSLNQIGVGGVSPGQEGDILQVGSRVEARFGGKSAWFPGRVKALHDRGDSAGGGGSDHETVAVDYDDGDTEETVPRVRVRLLGQKQPRLLNEGDEVDYKRGKNIALAGVVRRSETEGHYDLRLLGEKPEKIVENCPRHAIMALHGWPPGGTKSMGKS